MNLDVEIFSFFHSLAGLNALWDQVFEFLALNTLWLMWLIFIVFLIVTYDKVVDPLVAKKRLAQNVRELRTVDYRLTALAMISSGLSYLAAQVIGFLFFRDRPFVALDNVTQLIEKSALDPSFPSTHAILAFALAFSIFSYDKRWGWLFIFLALIQGLARVTAGVHYLGDILGSLLIAAAIVWLVRLATVKFRKSPSN